GQEVKKDSPESIAERVLGLAPGRRFYVMYRLRVSPDADSKGAARKRAASQQSAVREALLDLQKRGVNRVFQDARVHEFATPETLLDVDFAKPVYVLVDRLSVSAEARSRLVDSIEICYRQGGPFAAPRGEGEAILEFVPDGTGNAAERMVF